MGSQYGQEGAEGAPAALVECDGHAVDAKAEGLQIVAAGLVRHAGPATMVWGAATGQIGEITTVKGSGANNKCKVCGFADPHEPMSISGRVASQH